MDFHANHALGLPQRLALVRAIEAGVSQKAAAAAFCVAPATAHRWWHRWTGASAEARASLACLLDRSSRLHSSPRRLSEADEAPMLRARAETNLGPARLAAIVGRARSTVWKVLHRHGRSRRRRAQRQTHRRYEWSRPGALLHVDMAQLARFNQPGHRAVRTHLLELAGDRVGATAGYLAAARRTTSIPEQRYLEARAARLDPGSAR